MIQSAIGEDVEERPLALNWLENLVDNGCSFWLTLPLNSLNPDLEGNQYSRTILRNSGYANSDDFPILHDAWSTEASHHTWRQLTQAIIGQATVEQLENEYANTATPMLQRTMMLHSQ